MENISEKVERESWKKRKIILFDKQVPAPVLYSFLALSVLTIFFPKYFALVLIFFLFAYPLQVLAQETNTHPTWLAWVPIANLYLMCKIAGHPFWFVGLFIPIVHLWAWYKVGAALAEIRNSSSALGLLMLIPGLGPSILLWHLAFKKQSVK
jgi:hypothetical protein